MARPRAVTQHEAFQAITAIVSRGINPTFARVRDQIVQLQAAAGRKTGGGSPVVLQEYLDEWYEANGKLLADHAQNTPPPAMLEQLRQATELSLAQVAEANADREQSLDDWEAGLDARETDLATREDRHTEREAAQQSFISDLRAERDADRATALALKTKLDRAEVEVTTLRRNLDTLAKERGQLQEACKDAHAALAVKEALAAKAAQREAELTAGVEESAKREEAALAALAEAQRQLDVATMAARKAAVEASERLAAAQDQAAQERERLNAAVADANRGMASAMQVVSEAREELAHTRAHAASLHREHLDNVLDVARRTKAAVEQSQGTLEDQRTGLAEILAAIVDGQKQICGRLDELKANGKK